VITWAWTLAFALMVMANILLIYVPGLPLWSGLAIAFAARNSALYFTKWYPDRVRAKLQIRSLGYRPVIPAPTDREPAPGTGRRRMPC